MNFVGLKSVTRACHVSGLIGEAWQSERRVAWDRRVNSDDKARRVRKNEGGKWREREREREGEKGKERKKERISFALRVDLVHPFSGMMVAMLVLQQLSKIDITQHIRKRCYSARPPKQEKGKRQRAISRKSIHQRRRNPLTECFPPGGTACGCMCSASHIDHPPRFHVHCRSFPRVKGRAVLLLCSANFSISFPQRRI